MEARAGAAAEAAARAAYGRLLAQVARRTRDIAAAEDALSDAFRVALERWLGRGVPERPEAWLLTVARRLHGRARARSAVAARAADALRIIGEERAEVGAGLGVDRRLELMFVCAHPAIDVGVRTPLMLQVVLGLDAARIASAFLTAPAAMGQRLVRAKTKIRDAGLSFEEPGPDALDVRLGAVLDAVYAAYGAGWDDLGEDDPKGRGLAEEALYLARLVAGLRPDEPEAQGLLALVLYCEGRADARRDPSGAYVPLDAQDVGLWSRVLIQEAEAALRRAARSGRPGRYQTEAAIQSLHVGARLTGSAPAWVLARLYDLLVTQTPALGARIARACVYGADDAGAGLRLLDALDAARVADHQPYWAARAHLERAAGLDASAAFARAAGLSADPAVRARLQALAAG